MRPGHTPDPPAAQPPPRVFLLSPANSGGERMAMVLSPRARFPLAQEVQGEGAPLGEVFAFASGLYFRGKLAYARAFGRGPPGLGAAWVIAPGAGLLAADALVRSEHLHAFAAVRIDAREPRFRAPLIRDAEALAGSLGTTGEVVLLGSVATPKYVEPLLAVLGPRLLFPPDFVGRGDMSRGGLLLRAVRAGVELPYRPVVGAVVHGPPPPRLPRLPRLRPASGAPAPGRPADGGREGG